MHNFMRLLETSTPEKTNHDGFTQEQIAGILKVAFSVDLGPRRQVTHFKIFTLILLFCEIGPSFCDAVMMEVKELKGERIEYYRRKQTDKQEAILVNKPISVELQRCLKALAKTAYLDRFLFAEARQGKIPNLRAVESRWYKYIKLVFVAAGITDGVRTHRFRHAHAELLLSAIVDLGNGKSGFQPLQDVGTAMGHASDKMVRLHYKEPIRRQEGRSLGFSQQVLTQMVSTRELPAFEIPGEKTA